MKNKIYFKLFGLLALIMMFSCEPFMDENPESSTNLPPDPAAMDFTISPGSDAFHFIVELVSPDMSGIYAVSFDMGNGTTVRKESATAYYPLPGDYTITMKITTNGGSSSITKTQTTTETDYSIFDDEKYVALTGGIENTEGKTWVVDAESQGHFGVGDAYLAGGIGVDWWSAAPYTKEGTGAYDDELTFFLDGFKVIYENHGVSYVKGYMKDDPNLADVYLNPRQNKDDYDVDYVTPVNGSWLISERDGKTFLSFSSPTPIFPGLDVGALDNEYEILNISENYMELTCFSAYEDWTKWHFILRNKDYVKPSIEYSITVDPTGDVNTYGVNFTVGNIPAGESIDNIAVDFGDGTIKETADVNEVLTNTYMRKGTYNVTVTTTTSLDVESESFTVEVAENHPDYEEFLLDAMVMYADFSEVMLASVEGQDCFVATSDNPMMQYPNKSSKVGYYSKTNNQWANAFMQLPAGYRFDLTIRHTFKMMVNGKAGDVVLLKLENTDWGGDAWMSGVELTYTIQQDNTWEVAEYNFEGVSNNGSAGDFFTGDVTDPAAAVSKDFYNVIRIMLNPGNGDGTHEFYFDELAGPHVEGIKSASLK
ncbi:PKD domain-containing protein [Maribellus mangrovi]|uniref:PKD domain-containing protein n=1 Tax=Maribellus mangrovi TaxID=3133146 RepID=UPI0030EC7070